MGAQACQYTAAVLRTFKTTTTSNKQNALKQTKKIKAVERSLAAYMVNISIQFKSSQFHSQLAGTHNKINVITSHSTSLGTGSMYIDRPVQGRIAQLLVPIVWEMQVDR